MTDELHLMSATEMTVRFKARKLSPVEIAEAAIARIDTHDPKLNAFCLVDREGPSRSRGPPRRAGRAASHSAPWTGCRSRSRTWCWRRGADAPRLAHRFPRAALER